MTHVNVNLSGNRFLLEASGHAGQAESGKDIVCAGISALTQALLNTLIEDDGKGFLRLLWSMDEESGSLRVEAWPYGGHYVATKSYFRVAVTGLKAIAQEYADYIEIKEE